MSFLYDITTIIARANYKLYSPIEKFWCHPSIISIFLVSFSRVLDFYLSIIRADRGNMFHGAKSGSHSPSLPAVSNDIV